MQIQRKSNPRERSPACIGFWLSQHCINPTVLSLHASSTRPLLTLPSTEPNTQLARTSSIEVAKDQCGSIFHVLAEHMPNSKTKQKNQTHSKQSTIPCKQHSFTLTNHCWSFIEVRWRLAHPGGDAFSTGPIAAKASPHPAHPPCTNLPTHGPPTHPSVVMVTMVYQKEAGMLVNLLAEEPFSA